MKLPLTAFTTLLLGGSAFADWIPIATTNTLTSKSGEVVEYGNGLLCTATAKQKVHTLFEEIIFRRSSYKLYLTCSGEIVEGKPITAIMWNGTSRLASVSIARSPFGGNWVGHSDTRPTHVTMVVSDHEVEIPDMKDYDKFTEMTTAWPEDS